MIYFFCEIFSLLTDDPIDDDTGVLLIGEGCLVINPPGLGVEIL